jgi:hypothetical protein
MPPVHPDDGELVLTGRLEQASEFRKDYAEMLDSCASRAFQGFPFQTFTWFPCRGRPQFEITAFLVTLGL